MKVTKGDKILEISKECLLVFNALTDAEAALTRLRTKLLLAQQRTEELFLSAEGEKEGDLPQT